MTLNKSVWLGSAAAILSVAAAQAADLPSRKSAPVEYVRVCSAYGAGFFFIPGSDTCLKIGGRVRADYAYVPAKTIYKNAAGTEFVSLADTQHTLGWEARGRIDFDNRTQTAFGTVQATAGLRLARVTGILQTASGPSATSTGQTLEYAFVRFAGFTFGAARDNFAFMPSLTYGAGHWASFANGAKQISYTGTFGGGVSVTLGLQDYLDTATTSSVANGGAPGAGLSGTALTTAGGNPYYIYNSIPQINANVRLDQAWGALQIMGAYADVTVNNTLDSYDKSKGVYAVGAGAKINLPMLAKGDALYLTAAYASGMTEYTTNWTSFKSSAYLRDVGGYVINHPSLVAEAGGLEKVKSWAVAGLFEHYWAPQYRSVVFASYGQIEAPKGAKSRAWNGTTSFGDATAWNVGTNFAWLPTRGFEIGVEVIYARVTQDIALSEKASSFSSKSAGNVTGRLRVERTF